MKDDLLVLNSYYLASILTNTNDILKIDFCYLASIPTNTNDKDDNFTKKKLIAFN